MAGMVAILCWACGGAGRPGLALVLILAGATMAAARPVDLQLILAVDCSLSVDGAEYRLQMDGLSAALSDPKVVDAIRSGPRGAIALSVVQWAGHDAQHVTLPWIRIAGPRSAQAVAARIAAMPRATDGGATSVSAVMRFALTHFMDSPHIGDRQVLDISSDGRHNHGPVLDIVRREVAATDIQVNALTILNDYPGLDSYYRKEIILGLGAFVEPARDYEDYRRAMRRKLLREIRYRAIVRTPAGGEVLRAGP